MESGSETEMMKARSDFGDTYDTGGRARMSAEQDCCEDILDQVPGLFRLLDLIDERGPGGLVEKIVIDQASLRKLINTIQPGSYDSVSKINLKSLDKLSIKPTGLYGDRFEIVKFLQQARCLDPESAALLSRIEGPEDPTPTLHSGLYLALPRDHHYQGLSKTAYIVYWPETTTWDDLAASSSVRRNRVIFMRYLTKLVEQIIALVSPSQARAFVWDASSRNSDLPEDQQENDDAARLFSFEVAKSREQEDDVLARPGFKVPVRSEYLPKSENSLGVRLVPGEQKSGLLVSTHDAARHESEPFDEVISAPSLRKAIASTDCPIQLGDLSLDDLLILASNGLRERHKGLFETHERQQRALERDWTELQAEDKKLIDRRIDEDRPKIKAEVQDVIRALYSDIYPSYQPGPVFHSSEMSAQLRRKYTGLDSLADGIKKKQTLDRVTDGEFQTLKAKWIFIRGYLATNPHRSKSEQVNFINILDGAAGAANEQPTDAGDGLAFGGTNSGSSSPLSASIINAAELLRDPEFVEQLRPLENSYPVLSEFTRKIYGCLGRRLVVLEQQVIRDHMEEIISTERRRQARLSSTARNTEFQEGKRRVFEALIDGLRRAMGTTSQRTLQVNSVRQTLNRYGTSSTHNTFQFRWSGTRNSFHPARNCYRIYPLELTEQDSQLSRADEWDIPQPKLEIKTTFDFAVDGNRTVEFLHLIHQKCLVVVSGSGQIRVYIEEKATLEHSVNETRGKVTLNYGSSRETNCVYAFDQATRQFAVLHGQKELKLSIYMFDESFTNLRSRGSALALMNWYDQSVNVNKMCFVPGLEEVCLIDTSGRVQIFSLVTQQFRNEHLQIERPIIDAFSAPDGSCLLVAVADPASPSSPHKLLAFYWTSSTNNWIDSTSLPLSDGGRVVTRFGGKGHVHIISLNLGTKTIVSTALEVRQGATEFSFRSDRDHYQKPAVETFNNSLIDCHLEVWTRFPVVPAIARNTLSTISRQPRRLTLVSPVVLVDVEDYFAQMISTLENTTRKPIDSSLSATVVSSAQTIEHGIERSTSEFRLGSFIVELLCLIPLHLAITRDNRFIPLKDGVWDPEHERSMLGADVPAIIDALSLGWYESLFQSYMATKPVRVVSCMGEQSVGKSYCLNHFADTSFAGSAMRTTEGVWLSCTPTESYLLVSLDFEGVHSIERSAQEDALLVLFSTAISNLVLFRNNFAMSREIAGIFASFKSSPTVLDPHVNRGLFNSTLAIIIKDVTNADAKDIVKEFSLKFQRLVEQEQDQNFISRLHRGRVQIIPWPVINSPSFYSLFLRLRQHLDRQPYTHASGGTFLHKLKGLMAKIKTNDPGALDQDLAAHRAQQLIDRLPDALCYGRTEEGPLKIMDTDEELPLLEDMPVFFVPDFAGTDATKSDILTEQALKVLIQSLGPDSSARLRAADASYVGALQTSINGALDERLNLVQQWVTANVGHLPTGNQGICSLLGNLNAAAPSMRAAARLCSLGCSSCQLLCLRNYRHSGEHHCGTNHRCVFDCQVAEGHEQREACGLPAGHGGMHMCNVKAHSCGGECHLSNMTGCAMSCVKPIFHEGEHTCSARAHLCGQPCALRGAMQGIHGGVYDCPGTCNVPWDEPHEQHVCDNARVCPMECLLCRRLCCVADHLHGLESSAVHLCGQEHNCSRLCEADGICQIETRPSAIHEQFSGRHASFMYTRYTQVDRRLSCGILIPPGELVHEGAHTHSTADYVFHYCDVRCPNCEYLCTLPWGHPQQLHETSHGSMIATQWVIETNEDDGDANPVYELQGRKLGSGDEGAPMLCNLVCAEQGRHAHIDYCRDPDNCDDPECEHISVRMNPDPDRPKDWISHATFWARSGFKDPYSRDEQTEFAKCDVLCAGPEHEATDTTPPNPSYCTLPLFHAPQPQHPAPARGYISRDGHAFECMNPSRLQQAYHVIFVIDSSRSMTFADRRPLSGTPISAKLAASCNNRYGAVLSALYGFWMSRDAATSSSATQMRRDAYSVITFDHNATTRIENDFAGTPDQLIGRLIPQMGCGGVDFQRALSQAQGLITTHWSSDRAPVVVFLSDGECNISDNPVYDLCRTCVRLGKPLAFYSISFGTGADLSYLRRMAEIAHEVYASAPRDILGAARGNPCSYSNAIDSIQLADTFLGTAESLQKPRASLLSQRAGRRAMY